jgi:hypothetical protein
MTFFACGRSNNNGGNKMIRLSIPVNHLEKESEKAYGFNFEGAMVWLPKSQIKDFENKESNVVFWLPGWLVTEKSLETFINNDHEPTLF